jgi:hypothetical protein
MSNPAGGARLGGDTDLVHVAACASQSVKDNVEWIGTRRTSGEDQIDSFGQRLAEGSRQTSHAGFGADNQIQGRAVPLERVRDGRPSAVKRTAATSPPAAEV